jgi:hypothetical protein
MMMMRDADNSIVLYRQRHDSHSSTQWNTSHLRSEELHYVCTMVFRPIDHDGRLIDPDWHGSFLEHMRSPKPENKLSTFVIMPACVGANTGARG